MPLKEGESLKHVNIRDSTWTEANEGKGLDN
jgi:hypothetical protein